MIHGKTQEISVCSMPSGGMAKVDGKTITTPGAVILSRKDPHTIVFSKPGYLPQQVNLRRKTSGLIWVNLVELVPFCAIGMQLDDRWGGAYVIEPSTVTASLHALPSGSTLSAYLESIPKPLPNVSKTDLTKPFNNTGRARICVLQEESCNLDRFRVFDDEYAVGLTSPKTCMCWERKPGFVRLTGDTGFQSASMELSVEGGRTYFVSMIFDRFAKIKLKVLDEQEAKSLLNGSTLIKTDDYIAVQ
jgi:hypothetical protein